MYDSENIIVYEIIKEINFLHFRFIEYGNEQDHIRHVDENEKASRVEQALDFKSQGMSNIAIAQKLGVSEGAVRKWFKKHSR
jgi:DNA-binding NarL/FixJ family response regulator